jgi:hypothetical protein
MGTVVAPIVLVPAVAQRSNATADDSLRCVLDVGLFTVRCVGADVAAGCGFVALGFAACGFTVFGFTACGVTVFGFAVWFAPATHTGAPACTAFAGEPPVCAKPPAQAPTVAAPATPIATAARVRGRRLRR